MAVDGGRNWNGADPADPDMFSTYPALSTQPAREAAQVFAQRLAEHGIAVNSSVEQGTVPEGTSPIAAVRSASLNEIMAFMLKVQNGALQVETEVHRSYLASYGITEEQMNNVRQSAFARAYTSNILSIAYGKDILDILVAVLPCAWVYADYGYRLAAEFADTLDDNPHKSWVDMYKTDEFWQDSVWLLEHIEKLVADASEERKRELIDIFVTGVENEYMFWASAYDMQYTWKPEWNQER